ncbi:S-layer homology domain-containing protein, partial [Klebsiella pneumoniae]|uniref:S-layer homology domain-containing protein n=1 Tax=Klebsiella pneumoniae TaxID=573 RepID=UPI0025A215B2
FNKYLTVIDSTNSVRPDDKITRAELAKLLVDTGIIEVKQGNTDYTKYKDAEEIPTYAREAVSALYSTGIIEEFSDGEFKPNNPIVRDEFFKI